MRLALHLFECLEESVLGLRLELGGEGAKISRRFEKSLPHI